MMQKQDMVNKNRASISRFLNYVLPSIVLVFLLIYTYAKFFEHPYTGFRLDSRGNVFEIFVEQQTEPFLQVGDRVIKIDQVTWENFQTDLRKSIFDHVRSGEVINLLVKRGDQDLLIPWGPAGPNSGEIRDLLISEGWLGFFFWMAGTFALLALRPKDERWRLFIVFNYLTGSFLVLGSGVSFYHIWESAILLRILVWFCIPVYLHLHWIFPKPLSRLPKALIWFVYLGAGIMAVAQWLQAIPPNLYLIGYLLAVLGSVVLLVLHAVKQPEIRRDLGILLVIIAIAFIPSVVVGIGGEFLKGGLGSLYPGLSGGALLSLPLFPMAYVYAAHRHRLGSLELRVNNILSSFLFLTLVGTISIPLIIFIAARFSSTGASVVFGTIGFLLASVIVFLGYAPFQSFFERYILGIPLPSKRLLETYSTEITTSLSLPELIQVLQEKVFPSLLIRQFVFLQVDHGSLHILSTMGLDKEPLPTEQDIQIFVAQSGVYHSTDLSSDDPYSWIRLILPLKLGDQLIGFWLFGRRDPDDLYSQQEIPVLSSLANLTSIMLSNILQTENLKAMYEANIGRYEQEKLRLSRDLHDSILNEMAALLMRDDALIFSPEFQQAFEALTERLREILSDLRPPALNFGLKVALEDMAEKLAERNQNVVKIASDIQADGEWRYAESVENHSYRIVQEACENALKYAHAKTIRIVVRLFRENFDIKVEDDGVGFDTETSLKLDQMLAHKHFGLANMHERASLSGAEIRIESRVHEGTTVSISWKSKESV
jgi:signal transduction histidine kinase